MTWCDEGVNNSKSCFQMWVKVVNKIRDSSNPSLNFEIQGFFGSTHSTFFNDFKMLCVKKKKKKKKKNRVGVKILN